MRVLIAPDSFKGSAGAAEVAGALAAGWSSVRGDDEVRLLPQADGGEGTLDAAVASGSWRWRQTKVDGPDGLPVWARWLLDDHGRALVELAESSGIALMPRLDPWHAGTRGLGQVIDAALCAGARSVQVGLGSSASTDGGAGMLTALGLKAFDSQGVPIVEGASGLRNVHRVAIDALAAPPAGGVEILVDTAAPLTGRHGAAAVFGPQKGAAAGDIARLDEGLSRWARALQAAGLHADPNCAGAGAAGGVGFGLLAWGARAVSGSQRIAEITGLADQLAAADVILTGEGRFDGTSWTGKLVGHVLAAAARADVSALVVAGQVADRVGVPAISLTDLAGSADAAMADPRRWLHAAGSAAARRFP